jgi:hypothetical protein
MNITKVAVRLSSGLALMLTAVLLVACGDDGAGSSGAGGPTIAITQPAGGTTVTVPFTVTFTSSVPLGAEDTGLHHVHLYFDGNSDDYLIVRGTTVQVTEAPAGSHTMHLSLRNANHSAAGAEAEVPLTIGGAGGQQSPAPTPSAAPTDDGYEY